MRRPTRSLAVLFSLVAATLPALAGATPAIEGGVLKAGIGIADATWHVGAGGGQYTEKDPNAAALVTGGEIDPHNHANTQRRSYGVQSRLSYRALVIEGPDGKRIALVKSDAYLAQDILIRRVAQILAKGSSGIGYPQILLQASHNHSSPYYMSPAWGVWLFQDVFEMRAFEYHARQMALAIERAAASLRPARIGAHTVQHSIYKGQIAGATITDDGTPGGYPESHADFGLVVMRVEDVSNPDQPKPLAVWTNFGQHPESLDGYDLISADFLGPLERMVERDLGAPLVWSQGDVGSAEGPYFRGNNQILPDGVVRAWAHVGHAQTERGARYLADSIVEGWNKAGLPGAQVPMSSNHVVDYANAWVPGPLSHPYPSVSNCRTETTVEGNPGSPILGLPDCAREGSTDRTSMVWENLKAHGIPLPEHYDAPGFTAVEENLRLHLQAFRVGGIVLASCACEAQMDLILNFESRADNVAGNIFDGYDYSPFCSQNADTTWTCTKPSTTTVSNERFQRMVAQVRRDAAGWDAPENVIAANAEPSDPSKIWGNFTKTELSPANGYAIAVGVGHAGDYNGYTVSYREYMSRDHYRKALTSYGPHTADYMSTRMMKLAGSLNGGPPLAPEPHDAAAAADEARQVAISTALGAASAVVYDAWVAALPNDAGTPAAVAQPLDIERFRAATFTWRGGSNAVDNPIVRVERFNDGRWTPYADQSGEVQTMVTFPKEAEGVVNTYTGGQAWMWTASFEAFDAWPRPVVPGGQVPNGTYRFVVDGHVRTAGATQPYTITSSPFDVRPWEGIQVSDVRKEPGGAVSFLIAPITYPRTYSSPLRFVKDDGNATLCKTCSFRAWASKGAVATAKVTVERFGGITEKVAATLSNGRWVAQTLLGLGDVAYVARGDVVDEYGEINGARIDAQ